VIAYRTLHLLQCRDPMGVVKSQEVQITTQDTRNDYENGLRTALHFLDGSSRYVCTKDWLKNCSITCHV